MPLSDTNFLNWLWGVLSVLLVWLWNRLNRAERKADEARITLAERHYTKLEVHDLVDRTVKPIHDKLNDIGHDVKELLKESK